MYMNDNKIKKQLFFFILNKGGSYWEFWEYPFTH